MTTKAEIQDFLAQKTFAVVGVSRSGKKFGNAVFQDMKAKGYKVFAVNAQGGSFEGETCYASLAALPEKVAGVVLVVPPAETEKVVQEAAAQGITHFWMQPGAESAAARQFCAEKKLSAITGECIMMYLEPVQSIHSFHRFVRKVFGGMPK